jgi:hypothetical protein
VSRTGQSLDRNSSSDPPSPRPSPAADPEKLDPALIRPGRIDKKILLDYLRFEEALQMTEHYFDTHVTPDEREKMSDIWRECTTPRGLA